MTLVHDKLFMPCFDAAVAANATHPAMAPHAPVPRTGVSNSTVEGLHVSIAQNATEGIAQPLHRRLRAFVEVALARNLGLDGAALTAARNRAVQVLQTLTKAQAKADKDAAAAAPERFSQAANRDRVVPDALRAVVEDAAGGVCPPVPDLATVDLLAGLRALSAREGWDGKALPPVTIRPSKAASVVALPAAVRTAVDELGKLLYRLLPYPFTEEAARANPMPYMAVTHQLNVIFEARAAKAVRFTACLQARFQSLLTVGSAWRVADLACLRMTGRSKKRGWPQRGCGKRGGEEEGAAWAQATQARREEEGVGGSESCSTSHCLRSAQSHPAYGP